MARPNTRNPDHHDRDRRRDDREYATQRGPERDEIRRMNAALADHDVPGTPPLWAIRLLTEHFGLPYSVEMRRVKDARIQGGRPRHGALRSDNHVSRYEVELPIYEVNYDTVGGSECPECGGRDAFYRHSVHHHIAGAEAVFCLDCETKLYGNSWG